MPAPAAGEVAHGGGSFASTIGRIEHGWQVRPDLCTVDNPRSYLGNFRVNSLVHDPLMLNYLVKTLGADKITLGSDYPFPLGGRKPGQLIASIPFSARLKNPDAGPERAGLAGAGGRAVWHAWRPRGGAAAVAVCLKAITFC